MESVCVGVEGCLRVTPELRPLMLARHHFMNSSWAEVAAGLAGAGMGVTFLTAAPKLAAEVVGRRDWPTGVVGAAEAAVTGEMRPLDLPPGPTVVHGLLAIGLWVAAAALDARSA